MPPSINLGKLKVKEGADWYSVCPWRVGDVICSTNGTNPSADWPGTAWELYAQDRFLVGAGSSYGVGATGGAATVAISNDQMPSHNHIWYLGGKTQVGYGISGSAGSFVAGLASSTSGSAISIGNTGGGQPHENRPPYVAIYFWRRVS